MDISEKIEQLRKDKTPEEIESLLLSGELGKGWSDSGYPYIGNY